MSINSVMIVGRIGKLDLSYTADQLAVLRMSVATKSGYKDKQTNKWVDQTEWHNVDVLGKKAEAIVNYCQPGTVVSVEGSLRTDKWEDKSGKTQYKTKIKATKVDWYTNTKNKQANMFENEASGLPDNPVSQEEISNKLGF